MKMNDEFPLCDVDMVNKVLSDLELEKAMDFAFSSSELCCFGGFNGDSFANLSVDDLMADSMKRSFEEESFGGSSCTSGSISSGYATDKNCLMSSSAHSSFELCNNNSYTLPISTSGSASKFINTASLASLVGPVNCPIIKKPRTKSVKFFYLILSSFLLTFLFTFF